MAGLACALTRKTTGEVAIARARAVRVTDDDLVVDLTDGRTITVPLVWFPRLLHATPAQRRRWEFLGEGEGIHWPAIDEDLSVAGLLRGTSAPPSPPRKRRRSNNGRQPSARRGRSG
ncbi:MAG: DUF2442 domain-containing protein [Candidatus Rokubacteria bacterium]|nr:DUF2442 domain-containing protein [Candidatus Rokubacteria bacterium]